MCVVFPGVYMLRTRIFFLAPASQCVNRPTEAARSCALLTAEIDIPKRDELTFHRRD